METLYARSANACHGHVIKKMFANAWKMATGIVRSCLCNVLTDEEYLDEVDRCKKAKDDVREFLQHVDDDESCLVRYYTFASNLMNALERCISSCISTVTTFRSKSVKKEKVWNAFHKVRLTEVDNLWQDLFAVSQDYPR